MTSGDMSRTSDQGKIPNVFKYIFIAWVLATISALSLTKMGVLF